jgi:hypothetical protein
MGVSVKDLWDGNGALAPGKLEEIRKAIGKTNKLSDK